MLFKQRAGMRGDGAATAGAHRASVANQIDDSTVAANHRVSWSTFLSSAAALHAD